jgi:CheY-like chemotaxis protein
MKKRILIIEDNFEIRENAMELLELAGYTVICASDGRMGVEKAIAELPDIILSDIMMPYLNGHEVLAELKNNEQTKSIPFVYITSAGEKKEVEAALNNGASGYIRKPFDEDELMETIRKCFS